MGDGASEVAADACGCRWCLRKNLPPRRRVQLGSGLGAAEQDVLEEGVDQFVGTELGRVRRQKVQPARPPDANAEQPRGSARWLSCPGVGGTGPTTRTTCPPRDRSAAPGTASLSARPPAGASTSVPLSYVTGSVIEDRLPHRDLPTGDRLAPRSHDQRLPPATSPTTNAAATARARRASCAGGDRCRPPPDR